MREFFKLNLHVIAVLDSALNKGKGHNKILCSESDILDVVETRECYMYKGLRGYLIHQSKLIKDDSDNPPINDNESILFDAYCSTSTNFFRSLGFSHSSAKFTPSGKDTPGHLFIIPECSNICAFDFAGYLLEKVADSTEYVHQHQYLYLGEQEIMFPRNVKIKVRRWCGTIKYVCKFNELEFKALPGETAKRWHVDTYKLAAKDLVLAYDVGRIYDANGIFVCSCYELAINGLIEISIHEKIEELKKYIGTHVYICSISDSTITQRDDCHIDSDDSNNSSGNNPFYSDALSTLMQLAA
ncbi:MAG: hypothetical protein EBT29_04300, partial [Proteobacteria bacterium]|nr:hypothetical protein [Candidatus Fonsibacter sp. PEL4]